MRKEFVMTQAQFERMLSSMKSVPAMLIGGTLPESVQSRANRAWDELGREMGFYGETAWPVPDKSDLHFTAETSIEIWREAFIVRAGFRYGWENLESWARRMVEQAYEEFAR